MFVYTLSNNFVKLYSKGIEKEYFGTKIEYLDETNTFLFFYYTNYVRLYVINGMKKDYQLVQCSPKVNKIVTLEGLSAKRFIRFYKQITVNDNFIFYIPPIFFRECFYILNEKKYMYKLNFLYNKYKRDIKNGKTFSNI